MSHTPGPWHRNIRAFGKYPVVFAGRNTHIAVVQQQSDPKETESNIDLVAAAPDLLAALKIIAAYRPLTFAECSDAESIIGVAEAAIAKAEGKQ